MTLHTDNSPETTGTGNGLSNTDINEPTTQDVDAADENGTITDEDVSQPADDSTPESEFSWDFPLTADSTSLCEITNIIVEDDGDLLGDTDLLDRLDGFLNGDTEFRNDKEKLQAGQELLFEFFAKHNRA